MILLLPVLLAVLFAAAALEAAMAFSVRARAEALAHRQGRLSAFQTLESRWGTALLALRSLKVLGAVTFAAALTLETARRLPGWTGPSALLALSSGLAAAVLLVDVLARSVARTSADALTVAAVPLLLPLARCAAPLAALHEAAWEALGRLSRASAPPWNAPEHPGRVARRIGEAERLGELGEDAAGMIEGVMRLRRSTAGAVMTPRPNLVVVEALVPVGEALALAASSGHTRLPVFEGSRDRIVGVFDVRSCLAGTAPGEPVSARMRTPLYVPESKPLLDLLKDLRADPSLLTIVLDEYGGTAGLLTLDDLQREVSGRLAEGEPDLRWTSPGVAECDARMTVARFNAEFGSRLPEDPAYETLAGFVLSRLERVPAPGERFSHEALDFRVLAATDRRIDRLQVVASGRDKPPAST